MIQLFEHISDAVSGVTEVAGYLWQRGWAERNAGNISVNVTEFLANHLVSDLTENDFPCFTLEEAKPALDSNYFLVTGTGKRMRDIARFPEKNVLIIKLVKGGSAYQVVSGNSLPDLKPTSELPSHLSLHEYLLTNGGREKAVVHTHPNELIALTHIPEFCSEESLNHLLWGMHPETIVMVPAGVGFLPYLLPGSNEIARATLEKFRSHKVVVWEKHGCFAIGRDAQDAFDLIDTVSKSAIIYFLCRSAGYQPEGLTESQLVVLKELSIKFAS